ncbi:MAG: phosphoribosylamine--glycine ligase [Gemmatimonadales bacterium]
MNVLVVGGGGREHALCWALRRDLSAGDLFAAPGNPGTAALATNLPIGPEELDRVLAAVEKHRIDLVVVGPEAPLALGLVDRLREQGTLAFGPTAMAARLEASKAFAKDVMARAGVRTAPSRTFEELGPALEYLDRHAEPLVVKASGLAAGKGAVICLTRDEAKRTVTGMLRDGWFGDAGKTVVIETFLEGEELSVLALTNGKEFIVLPAAQDHKRLLDGDDGPNTGGMGAYSPVSVATPALLRKVEERVFRPTLSELARRGSPFAGVLYAGLMVDPEGTPWVVEFNCRFGDPEAQVLLPRIRSGLLDALQAVAAGDSIPPIGVSADCAVATVLAARGYPNDPVRGDLITLPENLPDGVVIFHAGTQQDLDGTLRTNGGRVLTITGLARTFAEARARSRSVAEAIQFEGKQFRSDIGWREARRVGAGGQG